MSPANILSIFCVIFIWIMFGIGYKKIMKTLPSEEAFDDLNQEDFE